MVKIGNTEVGGTPKIVSVVWGDNADKWAMESSKDGAHILEVRIDLYKKRDQKIIIESLKKIKEKSKLPIIATIRRLERGGLWNDDEKSRKDLFRAIYPYADAIDIELDSLIRDDVISEASDMNKVKIVSYHDEYSTPSLDELYAKAREATGAGADIVKIAALGGGREDVKRLLQFTLSYQESPLVTISTGLIGRVSRLTFPFFGSCLSYGFVKKPVATGQLHIRDIKSCLETYDPSFIKSYIESIAPRGSENLSKLEELVEALDS